MQPSPPPPKQPEGWRVKLYRLNQDGSWDDCGTGRIVCVYENPPCDLIHSSSLDNSSTTASATTNTLLGGSTLVMEEDKIQLATLSTSASVMSGTGIATPLINPQPQQQQHHPLGYATLCVHAEVPTKDLPQSQPSPPKILLRTRILLQDAAYQRQGDNIITWCEPFYSSQSSWNQNHTDATMNLQTKNHNMQEQQNSATGATPTPTNTTSTTTTDSCAAVDAMKTTNTTISATATAATTTIGAGVDLALSFQDNCGCLEIWQQIIAAQGRHLETVVAAAAAAQHHQAELQTTNTTATAVDTDTIRTTMNFHHTNRHQQQQQRHSGTTDPYGGGVVSGDRNTGEIGMTGATIADSAGNSSQGSNMIANATVDTDIGPAWNPSHHHQQQQQHYQISNSDNPNNNLDDQQFLIQQQQQNLQELLNNSLDRLQMPSPSVQNLDEIADTIAAVQQQQQHHHQLQQREVLALYITSNDCLYYRQLLNVFAPAEARGNYGKLATLAACVKTILLLNDPTILELTVTDASVFEQTCSCLEYDPDLREKANHRWFLRERVKFRSVVPMEDMELVQAIHRTFRVQYLRDTLLRPTMDESCLSTLSSLLTFIHADVIKGVTMSPGDYSSNNDNQNMNSTTGATTATANADAGRGGNEANNSYLVRVIRTLAIDLYTLLYLDWMELEYTINMVNDGHNNSSSRDNDDPQISSTRIFIDGSSLSQHSSSIVLDPSMSARMDDDVGVRGSTGNLTNNDTANTTNTSLATTATSTVWKQHVSPQDTSKAARRVRRRNSLFFLRELFQMVRLSLQQCDKDDFFAVICTLEVDLSTSTTPLTTTATTTYTDDDREMSDTISQTSQMVEVGSVASTVRSLDRLHDEKSITADDVDNYNIEMSAQHPNQMLSPMVLPESANLLSLLANLLLDPHADMSEKGAILEILSGIAMHDAALLRRHCLECTRLWKLDRSMGTDLAKMNRPEPNELRQVVFVGPTNDLLSAFVFLLDVETDAGVLLQVSEIMRIILDTDIMGDHGLLSPGFADEADGILPAIGQNPPHDQHNQPLGGSGPTSSEQAQFLSIFYEHYAEWLVAPFQYTILHPIRRIPDQVLRNPSDSILIQQFMKKFQHGIQSDDLRLKTVSVCPVRMSFTVELLSFCVRAHLSRMKMFLLKSRVMGNVLQLLRQHPVGVPGDRCLKLAILRFLRAVLSVNDESYHRHIIQNNLFASVFDAFRANPVGDNLVSSAVVEMCDYIHHENIKCLLDYIGRRHLTPNDSRSDDLSLEDVSSPYVSTLTTLRKAYEANLEETEHLLKTGQSSPGGSRYFPGGIQYSSSAPSSSRMLSGKALEDQRKFQLKDKEESYFEMDDDDDDDVDEKGNRKSTKSGVNESPEKEGDLHRTPRMFSLMETTSSSQQQQEEQQFHLGQFNDTTYEYNL
jgi:transcription initiation factor TFIIIB Brf1 subunit/transcription initiation factor TFIIB